MSEKDSFAEQEQIVLRKLAGCMISASKDLQIPGADDDVIFARLLERATPKVAELRRVMNDFFDALGGVGDVADLGDAGFKDAMVSARRKPHPFLEAMTALVANAYYTDPRVLASLDKEDRPPFPKGNILEQGDWSLLDPVKKRDQVFRNC